MSLACGQRLAHYEILAPLGAGGMGQVWRARDTLLKRDVALKLLPEAFVRDAGRMARFQREAEVLASLNHPNITAIYGIEVSNGSSALVMELAEGPTLAERIQQGPLPVDEALQIARQIADGLEYAHEKNVVHRDLKPANVKITPAGTVKILDFGLAKAFREAPSTAADPIDSPTVTIGQTGAGVILGTAAYMAPEQARGKTVDKRADIWAFGVVLYEMLTGTRLFQGADLSETLACVIKDEPRWDGIPEKFRPLLRSCLEKDPKRRLRDVGDALPLVEASAAALKSLAPLPAAGRSRREWLAWGAAGLSAAVAAAALPIALRHVREQPPALESVRFDIQPPPQNIFGNYLSISPNGRRLAFTAIGPEGSNRIWVRDLDKPEARALVGTENAGSIIWSPDSRFIAFGTGHQLKKSDVSGGSPVTLCESPEPVGAGSWSKQGVILFSTLAGQGLREIPEAGGVPEPVTASSPEQGFQVHPGFLPDGRHFIYGAVVGKWTGVHVGSLDAKPNAQPTEPLLSPEANAVLAPFPGAAHLLFSRGGTLMAQSFDLARLRLQGEVFPIADHVGFFPGIVNYSVSANGALAFRVTSDVPGRELVWADRSGKRLSVAVRTGQSSFEALSPDGKTVAMVIMKQLGVSSDIWLYDLARTTISRFTFGPGLAYAPVWSPDGSQIAYGASLGTEGEFGIYQKPAGGAGREQLLLRLGSNPRLNDWSRDGKTLVYVPDFSQSHLWLLPMQGEHKPAPYLQTQFREYNGQFSPDGRWMAYTSDESGREEVYVRLVPGPGAKAQISTAGGGRARWRRDGKELFYIAADQKLMSVPVKAGAAFEAGIPQPLFQTPIVSGVQVHQFFYTPSPDGQKFLLVLPAGESSQSPITVVLNWQAGLKK